MIVSAVADALVTTWAAAPALDDIEVRRGMPTGADDPGSWLLVGYNGSPEASEDLRADPEWLDLAMTRIAEQGEIDCVAVVQTGDSSDDDSVLREVSARALAIVTAAAAALRTDSTLDGLVSTASIRFGRPVEEWNRGGLAVLAGFTVAYVATYDAIPA